MSMLVDRQVKQKWQQYPRDKAWSEQDKFGQKVDWLKGKVLGAKDDGVHVEFSLKNYGKSTPYSVTNGVLKHEDRKRKGDEQGVEESPKKRKKEDMKETKKSRKGKDEGEDSSESSSKEITKKKKQKKKKETVVDNFEAEESKTNECDVPHSGKKEKKKKQSTVVAINPNFDENEDIDMIEVKRKKKKNKSASAIDNLSFDIPDNCQSSSDTFEVKRKKKKKKGIENPNFDTTDSPEKNDLEEKVKIKKKSKDESIVDNPNFDISGDCQNNNEVKKKKRKKDSGSVDNLDFQNSPTNEVQTPEEPSFDLILNVTDTPVAPKPPKSSSKRRKKDRVSDVNEEPKKPVLFDNSRVMANDSRTLDLDRISKELDGYEEVQNYINGANFIGEVGNPDGDNEQVPEGTKLKFRFANFGKSPAFLRRKTTTAKSSYKHLIKGDIILGFKNANLHEIVGYGLKK